MSFARMSLCDLAYLVVGDTEWPNWSGKRDSNPRPRAWKARALPTELFPPFYHLVLPSLVERGGFEPPKAYAGRFTVCSLWPLGNLSLGHPQILKARLSRWRESNSQPTDYKSVALPLSYIGPNLENILTYPCNNGKSSFCSQGPGPFSVAGTFRYITQVSGGLH